jgi:hypothetical protein
MKAAAILLMLAVAYADPASAITRYNSLGESCASVQGAIADQGAVLLRYPSERNGILLYDRYVSGNGQCSVGDYAARTSVPTKDNPMCPVYNCKSASRFNPR